MNHTNHDSNKDEILKEALMQAMSSELEQHEEAAATKPHTFSKEFDQALETKLAGNDRTKKHADLRRGIYGFLVMTAAAAACILIMSRTTQLYKTINQASTNSGISVQKPDSFDAEDVIAINKDTPEEAPQPESFPLENNNPANIDEDIALETTDVKTPVFPQNNWTVESISPADLIIEFEDSLDSTNGILSAANVHLTQNLELSLEQRDQLTSIYNSLSDYRLDTSKEQPCISFTYINQTAHDIYIITASDSESASRDSVTYTIKSQKEERVTLSSTDKDEKGNFCCYFYYEDSLQSDSAPISVEIDFRIK